MLDPPEDIKQVLGQKDQSWLTLDDAYKMDNNYFHIKNPKKIVMVQSDNNDKVIAL